MYFSKATKTKVFLRLFLEAQPFWMHLKKKKTPLYEKLTDRPLSFAVIINTPSLGNVLMSPSFFCNYKTLLLLFH